MVATRNRMMVLVVTLAASLLFASGGCSLVDSQCYNAGDDVQAIGTAYRMAGAMGHVPGVGLFGAGLELLGSAASNQIRSQQAANAARAAASPPASNTGSAVNSYAPAAPAAGTPAHAASPASIPPVSGIPSRPMAMPAGGCVFVVTKARGDRAELAAIGTNGRIIKWKDARAGDVLFTNGTAIRVGLAGSFTALGAPSLAHTVLNGGEYCRLQDKRGRDKASACGLVLDTDDVDEHGIDLRLSPPGGKGPKCENLLPGDVVGVGDVRVQVVDIDPPTEGATGRAVRTDSGG